MYREDFPIFKHHPQLIYFDNAATHQLPRSVIACVKEFYESANANPLRGLYPLSVDATERVSEAREVVASYLNAASTDSIIFTRGATDSLNLIALSLSASLTSDDEVIVLQGNHHSHLLPWLELCSRTGAHLKIINCLPGDRLNLEGFTKALTPNTRLVALSAMSNVTGHLNSHLYQLSQLIHQQQALMVVDAAQAIAHAPIDVFQMMPDFLAFSGHKLGAPSGIGVLYCRPELLDLLRPAYFGGEMVDSVHLGAPHTSLELQFSAPPHKFEAGTLNTGGIIGLAAALQYWQAHRPAELFRYVDHLTTYLKKQAQAVSGLQVHFAEHGIFTFNLQDIHPHDVAQALAANHIAVRAGYHCAQPLHEALDLGPTVRASLSFYNTEAEVDSFVHALAQVRRQLGYD